MAKPTTEEEAKKYGVPLKFDPQFNGPIKRRSCTDIICLLLFCIFLLIWIGVAAYAYRYGNPTDIIVPTDSKGLKCGYDSSVLNKKYLYFFDLTKCANPQTLLSGCDTPQVCVEKCPDRMWSSSQSQFNLEDVKSNIICADESITESIKTKADLQRNVDNGLCAGWHVATQPLHKRCLPSLSHLQAAKGWVSKSGLPINVETLSNSTAVLMNDINVKEFGTQIIQDFVTTWPYMVASIAVAVVISLAMIVLLRWIAGIVTWAFLLALLVLLGVGAYFSFRRYDYLKKNGPIEVTSKMLQSQIDSVYYNKDLWLSLGIIAAIVGLILLIIIIFLRNRIRIAVTLIEEGSKAVGSIMSTLLFPIIPLVLQCLILLWAVGIGVYLSSIGKNEYRVSGNMTDDCCHEYFGLKVGDICSPKKFIESCHCPNAHCTYFGKETSGTITILQLINVFGVFWGVYFVSGLSYMILASVFATWYWTFNKRKVPFFTLTEATTRVIGNHLGTIAFGSLTIAICSFIRALLEYTENKIKKYENAVIKAFFCCMRCFFWCLEKFLKFISRNAYIMCAIHGRNFCFSAKDAFNLLMRNSIRVVVLDQVTDFLFFIGKIVITAIMVAGAYLILFFQTDSKPPLVEVNYVWMPLIVIGACSFIVASIFFSVYAMAVDTLFLCFLEDCERNDGSPEKPYFMSKELMKVLGKRNKRRS